MENASAEGASGEGGKKGVCESILQEMRGVLEQANKVALHVDQEGECVGGATQEKIWSAVKSLEEAVNHFAGEIQPQVINRMSDKRTVCEEILREMREVHQKAKDVALHVDKEGECVGGVTQQKIWDAVKALEDAVNNFDTEIRTHH